MLVYAAQIAAYQKGGRVSALEGAVIGHGASLPVPRGTESTTRSSGRPGLELQRQRGGSLALAGSQCGAHRWIRSPSYLKIQVSSIILLSMRHGVRFLGY